MLSEYQPLVITNLVISETYELLRRNIGFTAAIAFLGVVHRSPRVLRIYSDGELETSAEAILRHYQDQDFSCVDAVSFAVMGFRLRP